MSSFRQVVPGSNKNKSQHLLCWLSANGTVRNWFFSHTDGDQQDDFNSITIESSDDIRSIPSKEKNQVEVITASLSSDEFNYVKSIMSSNRVFEINKDITNTPIALMSSSVVRDNKRKEHKLKITFTYKEPPLLDL